MSQAKPYVIRLSETSRDTFEKLANLEGKTAPLVAKDLLEIIGRVDASEWPDVRSYIQKKTMLSKVMQRAS